MKPLKQLIAITSGLAILLLLVNTFWGKKSFFSPDPIAAESKKEELMNTNLKRSDFKLKAIDYVKELKREITMRVAVYTKKVRERSMSSNEANKRWLIMQELKELMELADANGMTIEDIKNLIGDQEGRPKVTQGELFKASKLQN